MENQSFNITVITTANNTGNCFLIKVYSFKLMYRFATTISI